MTKKNEDPLLIIDGDVPLYHHSSAAEVEIDWGDDLWTLHSFIDEPKRMLKEQVEKWKDQFSTDRVLFCVSDTENFRKDVLPTYKSGRKGVRKPLAYYAMKDWVKNEYTVSILPYLEGDDVCGIAATNEPNSIVISEDKDLKTVPCTLLRQDKLETFDVHQANYRFLLQTLTGDATDGYKGCPSYGDKTAAKLLDAFWDGKKFAALAAWEEVVKAYESKELTEHDALVQARCARILRKADWDQVNQKVILWTPPQMKGK